MPSCAKAASRSAISSSRKRASASARATSRSRPGLASGSSCAASTQPLGRAQQGQQLGQTLFRMGIHHTSRRGSALFFREPLAEPRQAPRDPARDRPGGQVEGVGDRPVALVPGEEAVEDLAAVLGSSARASWTAKASVSSSIRSPRLRLRGPPAAVRAPRLEGGRCRAAGSGKRARAGRRRRPAACAGVRRRG